MRCEMSMITRMLCSMTSSAMPLRVNPAHQLHQSGDAPLVHAPGDLVEEQEPRPGGQRPRELEALALAGGEHARVRIFLPPRPTLLRAARARSRASRGSAVFWKAPTITFSERGEPGEGLELLERAADAATAHDVGTETGDVLPVQRHRAGVRALEAGEEVEERRLPGAIGPDDADQLAGRHAERHVPVGSDSAVPLGEPLDLEERRRAHPVRRRPRWASAMTPPGWTTEISMMSPPKIKRSTALPVPPK